MMQTILIIDDDAAIGNLEQEVSERAGYAVQHAYSGTEALLLLKLSRPYLILLDLMLAFLPLFLDLAAFYAKSPDRHAGDGPGPGCRTVRHEYGRQSG